MNKKAKTFKLSQNKVLPQNDDIQNVKFSPNG